MNNKEMKIGIIGLGYVGLPLAIELGKVKPTIGFDLMIERVSQLKEGIDTTRESSIDEIEKAKQLSFTNNIHDLKDCNFYIVCVPTPVDNNNTPDLKHLISASKMVASVLSHDDIVVYESTVYPGATEEVCIPVLEEGSSLLAINSDNEGDIDNINNNYLGGFYYGYSPERINPGDKEKTVRDIIKVTSGSTVNSAKIIDDLYSEVIAAGTYSASSIKVAEAAKVIENTQRDLNIAFINELSIIFDKMDIDTEEVLLAAETKWNFMKFRPGLVGGHCIGVDPYYLTHKASSLGYDPQIILSGRKLNDEMSKHVVSKLIKSMQESKISIDESRVLILGCAFKENCPDYRNTKVLDVYYELETYVSSVEIYDPIIDELKFNEHCNIQLLPNLQLDSYDAIIIAVPHNEIVGLGIEYIRSLGTKNHILMDMKYAFNKNLTDLRL